MSLKEGLRHIAMLVASVGMLLFICGPLVADASNRGSDGSSIGGKNGGNDNIPGRSPTTRAEKYVLSQIASGEEADMKEKFKDDPNDWNLGGEFLSELLTRFASDQYKVRPHGIQIKNANINGVVDLVNGEVPYDVRLNGCHFDHLLNLTHCRFLKSLSIEKCEFDGSVDFDSATVAYDLVADGCTFRDRNKPQEAPNAGAPPQFINAHFSDLILSGAILPLGSRDAATDFTGLKVDSLLIDGINPKAHVKIGDMNYQSLSPAVWKDLQPVISGWDCSAEFYENLEAALRRRGFTDDANSVYIQQRELERHNNQAWDSLTGKLRGCGITCNSTFSAMVTAFAVFCIWGLVWWESGGSFFAARQTWRS
jgi:hypothetical protein